MKIKIHLDQKRYSSKPQQRDIIEINKSITNKITECEIRDFIDMVGNNGQTFMPGLMNGARKKENFVGQQVYGLDFDEGITFEEFMERAEELELYPAFVYKTFSYTEEHPKFRAVYINDCIFEEWKGANILLKMLRYIYPESDKACVDASRIFFGGKANLYVNEDASINVRDVAVCLQAYIFKNKKSNCSKVIKKIGENLGIKVERGILRILAECSEDTRNGSRPVYILGLNQNSSIIYYIEENEKSYTQHAPGEYTRRIIQHKTIQDIMECCPLAKEFYEKGVDHDKKFMLATNLRYIKGGRNLFFQGIHDHVEKWEADWKTILINNYHPQSCKNGNCPYVDQCRCKNMCEKLERKITVIKHKRDYITLGEGEYLLQRYISDSINDTGKDINLIKAQTALGKTYAYCQLASQRDPNSKLLMIALPTIKLQNEVYDELIDRNLEVYKTISVSNMLDEIGLDELSEQVYGLYKKGLGAKVKTLIREYLLNNKDLYDYQKEQLQECLDTNKHLIGDKMVVTTHAMLLRLPETILSRYEIVVDEDILMTIFKNTGSVSFDELEKFIKSKYITVDNKGRIETIMQMPNGTVDVTGLHEMFQVDLERMCSDESDISGPIQEFLKSSTFHVNLEAERIDYFTNIPFPKVPMTIISATLNENIYRNYFRNRYIELKEVHLIQYRGTLKQYTAYSMSRSFIKNVGVDLVKRSIYNITKLDDDNIITFKMLDPTKSIYLGKTEGYNELKGKNICVVGTPHNVPFIYELIGKYLGYDVSTNANSRKENPSSKAETPEHDESVKMNVRKVRNEYYSFQMMTFENKLMQELQFYFLESELEQAIGRARLLRFDCTVFLFSNYPCRQAEIIQDDYLLDDMSRK